MSTTALEEAIAIAGSQVALAAMVGKTKARVGQWLSGDPIPEKICPLIEAGTGIACEKLRPDVQWERDSKGQIKGHFVPIERPKVDQARRRGVA